MRTRVRICEAQSPVATASVCTGVATESIPCAASPCPIGECLGSELRTRFPWWPPIVDFVGLPIILCAALKMEVIIEFKD